MQKDMHYYGTYAMARCAGLKQESCKIIARSAEFVDDNAEEEHLEFADGSRLDTLATAHHSLDIANIDLADQRQIWVPFHFIPGNQGNHYVDRLQCVTDSEIAREMVAHHLDQANRPYAQELIGICAHVYSDTFSHYGFSGVSSDRNQIVNDSIELHGLSDEIYKYVKGKEEHFFKRFGKERFLDNITSLFAEKASGALGHGAVLTYPDRPYLNWSFTYERDNKKVNRNNPQTFHAGCKALLEMFTKFAAKRRDLVEHEPIPFDQISDLVLGILLTQADCEGRIATWQKFAGNGQLFGRVETIPTYDAKELLDELQDLRKYTDSSVVPRTSIFKFFQAATFHRTYVLRELLPNHELLVA